MPKRVIVVTDGDCIAGAAVETATQKINGRCISLSGQRKSGSGYLEPEDLVALVNSAPSDPVVVMVDDEGAAREGRGERILRHLATHPEIRLLGVVAVASNGGDEVRVDASVARDGEVVSGPVTKEGIPQGAGWLRGDTLGVLQDIDVPVVIGLGDPGKMDFADDASRGAPVTTKALQMVLAHHGL